MDNMYYEGIKGIKRNVKIQKYLTGRILCLPSELENVRIHIGALLFMQKCMEGKQYG